MHHEEHFPTSGMGNSSVEVMTQHREKESWRGGVSTGSWYEVYTMCQKARNSKLGNTVITEGVTKRGGQEKWVIILPLSSSATFGELIDSQEPKHSTETNTYSHKIIHLRFN